MYSTTLKTGISLTACSSLVFRGDVIAKADHTEQILYSEIGKSSDTIMLDYYWYQGVYMHVYAFKDKATQIELIFL